MDQKTCLEAGIDYNEGVARCVGNAQLFEKFLFSFPADPSFGELEAALRANDIPAAFRAAHTLKGVTGNLSMTRLYTLLVGLTDALRGEGDMAAARAQYPAVKEAYDAVVCFIGAQG